MMRPTALLILAALPLTGCERKSDADKPQTSAPANPVAPPTGPRARPAAAVSARPPGAPSSGELLAFAKHPPEYLDWRKLPLWSTLVKTNFRLPRGHTRFAAKIIDKGWTAAKSDGLAKHLEVFQHDVDTTAALPPCAPLRQSWTHTELLLGHRSLFTLKMLHEALLLRARQHQHAGRVKKARADVQTALRLACHMTQVPEVIMQLMALRAERMTLKILDAVSRDSEGCRRAARVLATHASRRARLDDIARADWLMARSHLRTITKDLTKVPNADAAATRRLKKLKQLIVARTSAAYGRYSLLLRRGLAHNRPADWKGLDGLLAAHRATLDTIKKQHGVKYAHELSGIVAKFPNKPPTWTADIMSKVFIGIITLSSSIWKRTRNLHTQNTQAIARLRRRKCATRPRPSVAP